MKRSTTEVKTHHDTVDRESPRNRPSPASPMVAIAEKLLIIAEKILGILDEISALLFSMRTHSTWLTIREAERYTHSRNGELREALDSGELKSFRRTPKSAELIMCKHLDEWMVRTWITLPHAGKGVEQG